MQKYTKNNLKKGPELWYNVRGSSKREKTSVDTVCILTLNRYVLNEETGITEQVLLYDLQQVSIIWM